MSQKIIANIFNYAAREDARRLVIARRPDHLAVDYHFEGGDQQSFRVPKKLEEDFLANLRKILAIAPGELSGDKYCKIADKNSCLTFRVTILPDKNGEKIIINIIGRTVKPWRLSQLGLQAADLKTLRTVKRLRSGLILIAAPDGHGKSATLFSLLSLLNDPQLNIYFLSRYPEPEITGINRLKLTAANWEKVLRHDSDIIAADNLDGPSLSQALRAAATGRLVLATISADNAFAALSAILKNQAPLKLKLDGLKMIIGQNLLGWRQPKSRSARNRSGIGVFEILKITPNLKKFILNNETAPDKKFWEKLATLAAQEGFRPLEFDRRQKTKDGLLKK